VGVDLAVADVGAECVAEGRGWRHSGPTFETGNNLGAAETNGDAISGRPLGGAGLSFERLDRLLQSPSERAIPAATKLGRRLFIATRCGSEASGWRDLLDLGLTGAWSAADLMARDLRRWPPPLPMTIPGLAVVDRGTRHVVDEGRVRSRRRDARVGERFLDELRMPMTSLMGGRCILVRIPLRGPGARDTQGGRRTMTFLPRFSLPCRRRRSVM